MLVPNRPTPDGIILGEHIARLWKYSMLDALIKAPPDALAALPERCKTCAFREGTLPNGCPETLLDALKCVIEKVPFMCHQDMKKGKPTRICSGWILTQRATTPPSKAPWDWTAPEAPQ